MKCRASIVRSRTAWALLSIAMATSLGGCYTSCGDMRRGVAHARLRDSLESKTAVKGQLERLTCFQLSEWEQIVHFELERREGVSVPVLRDDWSRIRDAMPVRGCPSREQMLAAGTPPPVKGSTLKSACVCWQPYRIAPIAKGSAGPDCVIVRAEVSPGTFAFFENVPTLGERRHEIDRSDSFPFLGSLDRRDAYALTWGWATNMDFPAPSEYRIGPDAESDDWIESSKGRFRFVTDDCRPTPPEQANVVERTVIHWVAEP